MTSPKTLIVGIVPEDFGEDFEEKTGIETKFLERDGAPDGHDVQFFEDSFNNLDCVIYGFTEDDMEEYESVINMMALDKSFKDKKANIIPIKFSKEAVIHPSLSHLKCMEYDEIGEGSDAFWEELKQRICQPENLEAILPVGNVAHGLVHNYFRGYLMRIMKKTPNSEPYVELYKQGLEQMKRKFGTVQSLEKLVLLLPKNCTCKEKLNEFDDNIEYLENYPISKTHDRAGQEKIMLNALYKIEHNGKVYVLLLEVPNIITTISKLLNREGVEFSKDQLHIQYEIFKNYLKEALDFEEDLKHAYHIIEFDECDVNLKLGKLIADEVEALKSKGEISERKVNKATDSIDIVSGTDELDEELKVLADRLQRDGIKVVRPEDRMPGVSEVMAMKKEMQRTGKTLFWITEDLNKLKEHLYYEALDVQRQKQRGLLLPVVKGKTFPRLDNYRYLQVVNHLYSEEPDFYQKLLNAIKGETPLTYPLGDIASGLVWAYCLNYLEFILEEVIEKYNTTLGYDEESVKFPKFICLLPKSCHAPGKVVDYDPKIEYNTESYREEFTVAKMISGKERRFNKQINRFKHNGKTYKVLIEFATPLAAIAETEIGMKTQLSEKHKHKQREIFNNLLKAVVRNGKENSTPLQHCELLEFDDEFEDQTKRKGPNFNLSEIIANFVDLRNSQIQ